MTPTVLIVSHVIPFPPAAGNEIRILKMIQWLRAQRYRVAYLLNAQTLKPEVREGLRTIVDQLHLVGDDYGDHLASDGSEPGSQGVIEKLSALAANTTSRLLMGRDAMNKKASSDDLKRSLAPPRLVRATRALCAQHDPCAVIAEYVFATPCLDVVPRGVLRIVDTHDMFSRKKKQVLDFGIEDPRACTSREERQYLLKSDLILAIQSVEAEMFKALVPERDVVTVGIDYNVVGDIDDSAVVPGSILVVGSSNALNLHGLNEFYRHAWPSIRARNPEAVLQVVGKLGKHFKPNDDRVELIGWVEDLNEVYRKAAVVINPTVAGTGLKIKSVEALCQAKALVATANSVEGIDYTGEAPFAVSDDWEGFAGNILRLLASAEQRLALQQTALRFAQRNFSSARVYAQLAEHLRRVSDATQRLNID